MSDSHKTPGPAAKRRRVEQATATLRKPFRSPMINRPRQQPSAGTRANYDDGFGPSSPVGVAAATTAAEENTPVKRPAQPPPPKLSATTPNSNNYRRVLLQQKAGTRPSPKSGGDGGTSSRNNKFPNRRKPLRGLTKNTTDNNVTYGGDGDEDDDDPLTQLRKSQRVTTARMRDMKLQLNMIREARRIEQQQQRSSSPTKQINADLRDLIEKWKLASRQAADDLFELIKGRVDGMGGAKAWRETRKRQRGYSYDDNNDNARRKGEGGGECDERGENEREQDEEQQRQLEGEEVEEQDKGEEMGFTMLMMLKSLNIEPDVLGWDPLEDKWWE
ncbi:hypothetical protein B0H66DRAFT_597646 [Apodospora peruviana]|uniref:Swi5-dependent recombination DNA repair protein 1 n=1 Tax=Apodospora peruviana TaxID=516989 RepID=A0AAE0IS10_9PEZI|nr:hypothetical protein B0H66DRAFT_597646 [Apodospora peruviana]